MPTGPGQQAKLKEEGGRRKAEGGRRQEGGEFQRYTGRLTIQKNSEPTTAREAMSVNPAR